MKKLALLALLATSYTTTFAQSNEAIQQAGDKINYFLYSINKNYVDTINNSKLLEDGMRAMLKNLDPHSVYLTAEELKVSDEPLKGNFDGVGITFNLQEDTILVVDVIDGGPSKKAGLLPGDRIVKVDDTLVAGVKISQRQVMKKLRGVKGTQVKVGILRFGEQNLLDYTITRDKIPLHSVYACYMVDTETGYIKLSRFAATSTQEIKEGIQKLKAKGMKNLIFDLTDNGGGYLSAAIDIGDIFIKGNELMVYTEGVHSPRREYKTSYTSGVASANTFEQGKLIIMIDEGSASASEIVSGGMQDHDRAILVGRRTFGKGLVQNTIDLPDGSAMRLTTSRYYIPSGRCIQRPYNKGVEEYREDIYDRIKSGELFHLDSVKLDKSKVFYTKNKREVYAGGGVMPDVYVTLDTVENVKFLKDVIRKGLYNKFINRFLDKNRTSLQTQYPTFQDYKDKFTITDAMMKDFMALAEKEKIEKPNKADAKIADKWIKIQLKANIANNVWTESELYEIINEQNEVYKKAVEIIKSNEFQKRNINE